MAQAAGRVVADRAPRPLGLVERDGFAGSLETGVGGRKLSRLLASNASRATKMAYIDRVAAWAVDVLRATARAPEALGPARAWLASEQCSSIAT
jgi:hypothetical protein